MMLAALTPVDYGELLLYLGALLALGIYGSSRQKTTTEFFLGGRSLGWWPLGLSLSAAMAAGLTFSELPGQAYEHGLRCWLIPAALWLILPVVVYLAVPLFRGLALDSLFQYLEHRFDARVRLAASLLYVAWRMLWLAAIFCAACKVLALAAGWRLPDWMLIALLGAVATLYTFLGGMRAVSWAGVLHVSLLLLGAVVVIGGVWWHLDDGPARVAEVATKLGRMRAADFEFQWTSDRSLWALLPHWLVAGLAFCISDHVAAQRFLSAQNVNVGRTAFLVNSVVLTLLLFGLIYAGLGLLAFYQDHPRQMRPEWVVNVDGPTRRAIRDSSGRPLLESANPAHAVTWENIHQLVAERRVLQPNDKRPFASAEELVSSENNRLLVERLAMRKPSEGALGGEYIVHRAAPIEMLPWFAGTQLPWGLKGLVVMALLAAALAAFDASLSAIGATIVFDLHRRAGLGRRWLARRLGKEPGSLDAADELQLARPLTLVVGAAGTGLAVAASKFAESLETLLGIASAAGAPLLGVFLLGMLTRRATSTATLVATVAGLALSLCLIPQTASLAGSWVIVFGALFTFGLGYLLSFLFGRRKSNQELRGLVAGCGTLGVRSVDETPRITVPARVPASDEAEGIRWK